MVMRIQKDTSVRAQKGGTWVLKISAVVGSFSFIGQPSPYIMESPNGLVGLPKKPMCLFQPFREVDAPCQYGKRSDNEQWPF
jgi:hypothetical protein